MCANISLFAIRLPSERSLSFASWMIERKGPSHSISTASKGFDSIAIESSIYTPTLFHSVSHLTASTSTVNPHARFSGLSTEESNGGPFIANIAAGSANSDNRERDIDKEQ